MVLLNEYLKTADNLVWGTPLLVLIVGTGVFFTLRLGFLQIRHLPKALRFMLKNEKNGAGEVSSFGALCTALSATIGTGNIVGVATAVSLGGPGALFWMWTAAFFGMATKFAECTLAVKYRTIDAKGRVLGGPFMYIEKGLGSRYRILAKLFALSGAGAGLLGIGTITQVNGIATAVQNFFDPQKIDIAFTLGGRAFSQSTALTAVIVTALAGFVIIGGIKRIARVTEIVVPFMVVLYVFSCLFVLIVQAPRLPAALAEVFSYAFTGKAAGGGFMGAAVQLAIQKGVSRGVFSNEAGLGSAPMAAAAAKTHWAAKQGLISMTGTFIDTLIICTMTGLAIISTGAWQQPELQGVQITAYAFRQGFYFAPELGNLILTVCLVFFAFTTILGWNYYSEKCVEYLCGGRQSALKKFRMLFILALLTGPFMSIEAVWNLADIMNGLMAFPNLIALLALSGVVASENKLFLRHLQKEKKF
ncbi:MAG: alanine/glycine:cation symporter family protein [Bacillota bacterium]|jgi:AGCS family alanine or glycine:cation symporter